MFFPVSGIEVNPFVAFGVACVISFFTSMGGVSGAFMLLPFQVSFLGYSAPSVSATNQVFNIVAIPSGVYRYIREGRMLWPLTWAVIIGTLPGVFIGAWARIIYLPNPKNFKLFVAAVLLYIGLRLLLDVLRRQAPKSARRPSPKGSAGPALKVLQATWRQVAFEYDGATHRFSPLMVYLICLLVGVVGGVYGIGGGSIVAPFFVAIVGLPVHTIAGAALMGTFITSVAGVGFYQLLSRIYTEMAVAPDWILGVLFGAGGLVGMYLGARSQRFVPAPAIKGILCGCVLFVAGKYILEFFR